MIPIDILTTLLFIIVFLLGYGIGKTNGVAEGKVEVYEQEVGPDYSDGE